MDGSTLILALTRLLQLLSAAVVLGTSISLTRYLPRAQDACNSISKDSYCDLHGLIPAIGFGCVVGAIGLLDAIAGCVTVFKDLIPTIIMMGADVLAAVCYLAGGLAIAVILGKPVFDGASGSKYTEVRADDAFMFIGLLATIAAVGLGFMWRRSGKLHSAV